jgi:hypothetical protein
VWRCRGARSKRAWVRRAGSEVDSAPGWHERSFTRAVLVIGSAAACVAAACVAAACVAAACVRCNRVRLFLLARHVHLQVFQVQQQAVRAEQDAVAGPGNRGGNLARRLNLAQRQERRVVLDGLAQQLRALCLACAAESTPTLSAPCALRDSGCQRRRCCRAARCGRCVRASGAQLASQRTLRADDGALLVLLRFLNLCTQRRVSPGAGERQVAAAACHAQ